MTPETSAGVIAIVQAIAWPLAVVAIMPIARNALRLWIRFKEDQAAIERAQGRPALDKLGVAQPVPRGTSEEARELLRGNRERLSALSRPGDVVIPDDLEAHCAQWEDGWAREDERTTVRAKFVELYDGDAAGTWQRVRRAVGIGELP